MVFDGITFSTKSGKMAHLEVERLNPNILTAGSPKRMRMVADFLEDVEVFEGGRGHVVVNGAYNGLKVSAVSTGMGPASAMIILPEIIEATKGDLLTILRLGTAGSLQPYVRGGHLHIPTASIRDEGSSQAVIGLEFPATASPELIPILVLASERHGYRLGENLWLGPVHTKDNLYFRETPHFSPRRELLKQRLSAFREMGALSSEMEFSAYCILRDYYEGKMEKRILTGCILAVVNDFEEAEGRIRIGEVDISRLERDMIKIGLETFKLLNELRRGKSIGLDEAISKMISMKSRRAFLPKGRA
ncbi:MAG: hypothetical protein J7J28_01100 [Thaumarchaeota archaeon]|nr:hypothetical protein [Nitrososphaerota archaeon]